jgi:hypothetical protein
MKKAVNKANEHKQMLMLRRGLVGRKTRKQKRMAPAAS